MICPIPVWPPKTKSNKPLDMSLRMRMTPLAIQLSSTDTGSVYYRLNTTPCTPTGLLGRLAHKNLDCFVRLIACLMIRLMIVRFCGHISTYLSFDCQSNAGTKPTSNITHAIGIALAITFHILVLDPITTCSLFPFMGSWP